MTPSDDKISTFQVGVYIFNSIIGVGIFTLPSSLVRAVGTDAWMIPIIVGIINIGFIYLFCIIGKKYSDKGLVETLKGLFGKILGTILAIPVGIYFIALAGLVTRIFAETIKVYLLSNTPLEFIIIPLLILSIFLVRSGVEPIARFYEAITPLIIIVLVLLIIMAVPNKKEITNLRPYFTTPILELLKGLKSGIFAFTGFEVLLVLFPFIRKPDKAFKASFISMLVIIGFYVIIVIECIARFGAKETKALIYPTMTLIKTIQLPGGFIEGMEGILISIWVIFVFTTITSFVFTFTVIGGDLLKHKKPKHLPVALLPILYLVALSGDNIAELVDIVDKIGLVLGSYTTVIIPILMIAIMKLRKLIKKDDAIKEKRVVERLKHKKFIIVIITLTIFFSTGCWDMVEIDNRALVGAIIIDIIEENVENQEAKQNSFCEEKPKVIKVTFGLNDPAKLTKGEGNAALTLTVEAANIPDAMERFGGKVPRVPFYGQARTLILTKKLIKNDKVFREVLDEFERRSIVNQNMKVVVFDGNIDRLLEVKPKLSNLPTIYINGILENSKILSSTVMLTIAEFTAQIRNNDGMAALPLVEAKLEEDNSYVINKLALIKDYKLHKILDTKYVKTYKILNEELHNGRKLVPYKDTVVPYIIYTSQRKIYLEEKNGRLNFLVEVELEGDVEEFLFGEMLFDAKVINDIEKVIKDFMERELEETTEYFKWDVGEDYLGFKEYTNKYHYKIFKKYEDNWPEAFKNSEIEYEVNASVRRIGTSKE